MKLGTKLAAGALGVALASAGLVAARFLEFSKSSATQAQEAELDRLVSDIQQVRREAEISQDPLMIVDTLRSMLANRPELAWFRVERGGFSTLIEPKSRKPPAEVVIRKAPSLEVAFSKPYLDAQLARSASLALRDMQRSLLNVLPVALLLALSLSWSLSRRIRALGETLAAIGSGKFGAQTRPLGKDEIGKLAQDINSMSERLKELEAMKKTFIASVTHELRSPLASIESCVKLILSGPAQRAQVELDMLRRIQANASRLEHFVTNLLEMAKIERGKLEMRPRPCNLKPLIEDAVLFFEPKAREGGLSLELKANGDLPERVSVDSDLITQVLGNLVSNAIKFTPRGGRIEVTALRRAAQPASRGPAGGKSWLEVNVKDSGVGIPPEAQARLFGTFERIPNSLKASGTGLGLAISKSIIEMHGGRMGVESAPGRGSRFYFQLPLEAA